MSEQEGVWRFYGIAAAQLRKHGWEVALDGGGIFYVPLNSPVEPRAGDSIGIKMHGGIVGKMALGECVVYDVEDVSACATMEELDAVLRKLWGVGSLGSPNED